MYALLFAAFVHAGSMSTEVNNALSTGQGDGTADDLVVINLHFGAEVQTITGRDYQSFKVFEVDGTPSKIELYHGQGTEKHNILINVSAARYYRLNMAKRGGEWHFDFDFYY